MPLASGFASSARLGSTDMAARVPYIHFPGTAREALTFYGDVFGCDVQLHTFHDFNRSDGPADAIAHDGLTNGPVNLFGSDVSGDERPVRSEGLMLSLLGVGPVSAQSMVLEACGRWPNSRRTAGATLGRL